MSWILRFTPSARREIGKLDSSVRGQLQHDLQDLSANPYEGKHLSGRLRGVRSWRSEDYRILYGVFPPEREIVVYRVAHRREVYR